MHRKSYQTRSSNAKEKGKYVQWSREMDHWLAKLLAEEVKKGNKTDSSLKPAAYMGALTSINEKFGLGLTRKHLKNRLKTWRKQFGILKELLVHKGFQWDEKQRMVVADASVWNDYIKAHPDARQFRGRSIDNYDEFCLIIGYNQALAGCLENDSETHMQSDTSRDALDSASSSGIQSDDNHVKTLRWTDAMDYYLGKSLVEKVKKGYKLDNTLWQEAYDIALSTLSEKIGLELTKDHIKYRLKTWKKQYDALKQLFSHPGFKWDKTRKMVIADDSVWTDYVKRNPDARFLRGRIIRNYNELCAIFGCDDLPEGSLNSTNDEVNLTAKNEVADTEDLFCYHSDVVKEKGKYILWTNEMDRCLAEQLVEQVTLGNKLLKSFKPVAFKAALSVLNKKFSLDLTTENIRNRLKTWRKQYRLVKELLSQHGFQWDEGQKMVIANDLEWREWIKRNPDVSYVRGRTIDNLNELHIIVGNEQADGDSPEAGNRVVNPIQNDKEPVEAPVQVVVDEEMDHGNTDDDVQVSSQQTRARHSSSSHSKEALKRKRTSDVMLELMSAMAENIGRIADALTENNAVCLDEVFQMVQKIPEFDDDLIVDACEYLALDEKRARMFLKLDERLRKRWLLKRLRG
ncbi:hypothetical protein PTKIN_Ptkin03bG0089600 [Pterospermum kingtungense]